MWLDEDPCATEPVGEPRVTLAYRGGQRLDTVRKGLRAALARPIERVLEYELAHFLPFAGVPKERQRLADEPACGQEMAGAHRKNAALVRRNARAKLLQQELAEQRVVVIRRLLTRAPIGEQVVAVQVFEQARRL